MTTNSISVDSVVAQDKSLLAGIDKALSKHTFIVNDQPCTAKEVVAVLQARIDEGLAVQAARAALQAASKRLVAKRTSTGAFVTSLRAIVKGMFQSPATLAEFGLQPRKSAKPTLETKVAAVEKIKATRIARGTLGPKATARIKG